MNFRALLALSVLGLCACPAEDDETDGSASAADDGSGPGTSAPADDGAATMADDGAATQDDTAGADGGGLQATWGAPCATNDDCIALLGPGGECLFQAVVYELPGGYCSKKCALPDDQTLIVLDAPDCDPAGGVHCIGQSSVDFQYCTVPCTDDSQCTRENYECRQMPQLAQEGDPTFCLMADCCLGECACG